MKQLSQLTITTVIDILQNYSPVSISENRASTFTYFSSTHISNPIPRCITIKKINTEELLLRTVLYRMSGYNV